MRYVAPAGGFTISSGPRGRRRRGCSGRFCDTRRGRRSRVGQQAVLAGPLTKVRRPDDQQPIVAQVMPAARRIVAGAAAVRAGARGTSHWRACRTSAQTSRSTQTVGRRNDGVRSNPAGAVQPLCRCRHHGVEDRRGAGDAGRGLERRAIEVADPDADGHVARVADGPVVVIRLRRAGLHGDMERELEAPAAPEDVLARVAVGQDVADPERRGRRDDRPARGAPASSRRCRTKQP